MSTIALRQAMNARCADDVIMAILGGISEPVIPSDPSAMHGALHRLQSDPQFQVLLAEFVFDESALTPFSDLLDRVMFRLEASILKVFNPDYAAYDLNTNRELLLAALDKFSDEERAVCANASREFQRLVHELAVDEDA